MREAVARADADFQMSAAPRPRRRRSEESAAAEPSRLRRFVRLVLRRPMRTVLGATASALVVGACVNALFLQTSRHPAPLFGERHAAAASPSAAAGSSASPARRASAEPPAPAPRPVDLGQTASVQAPPAATPAPVPVARPADHTRDAIGALLRGGAPQAAGADESKRITAAQRALEKLKFGVSVDGVIGPGTRAAIQKFEREQKLPVTGELTPRTLKALAARSGVAIP